MGFISDPPTIHTIFLSVSLSHPFLFSFTHTHSQRHVHTQSLFLSHPLHLSHTYKHTHSLSHTHTHTLTLSHIHTLSLYPLTHIHSLSDTHTRTNAHTHSLFHTLHNNFLCFFIKESSVCGCVAAWISYGDEQVKELLLEVGGRERTRSSLSLSLSLSGWERERVSGVLIICLEVSLAAGTVGPVIVSFSSLFVLTWHLVKRHAIWRTGAGLKKQIIKMGKLFVFVIVQPLMKLKLSKGWWNKFWILSCNAKRKQCQSDFTTKRLYCVSKCRVISSRNVV